MAEWRHAFHELFLTLDKMMRAIIYFTISFILFSVQASAQFNWVEIGVNGLTCSQCSRSTELSIKKLDFVEDVQMDLEHTQGKITFKSGKKVSIEKIARAVVDAGFSVRYLKADFVFDNLAIENGSCFLFENRQYQFVKTGARTLKGNAQVQFLGKNFLPKKEYKDIEQELKPRCGETQTPVFFITLL